MCERHSWACSSSSSGKLKDEGRILDNSFTVAIKEEDTVVRLSNGSDKPTLWRSVAIGDPGNAPRH
jgi:hypothetical protein